MEPVVKEFTGVKGTEKKKKSNWFTGGAVSDYDSGQQTASWVGILMVLSLLIHGTYYYYFFTRVVPSYKKKWFNIFENLLYFIHSDKIMREKAKIDIGKIK